MAEPGFEPWSFSCPSKYRNHSSTEVDASSYQMFRNYISQLQVSITLSHTWISFSASNSITISFAFYNIKHVKQLTTLYTVGLHHIKAFNTLYRYYKNVTQYSMPLTYTVISNTGSCFLIFTSISLSFSTQSPYIIITAWALVFSINAPSNHIPSTHWHCLHASITVFQNN